MTPHLAPLIDHTTGWHPVTETPPSSWWLLLHNADLDQADPTSYYVGRYTQSGWRDLCGGNSSPTHWHILPDPVTLG